MTTLELLELQRTDPARIRAFNAVDDSAGKRKLDEFLAAIKQTAALGRASVERHANGCSCAFCRNFEAAQSHGVIALDDMRAEVAHATSTLERLHQPIEGCW